MQLRYTRSDPQKRNRETTKVVSTISGCGWCEKAESFGWLQVELNLGTAWGNPKNTILEGKREKPTI